jgi:hypothetical protein
MVVIAPAAGFLLLISVLYELGAYENTEPSERPNELVALAAAVALIAALVALCGLATRLRAVTAVAAIAQGASAVFLLVLWTAANGGDARAYRSTDEDLALLGVLVVILIDLLMLWVSRRAPAPPAPDQTTTTVNRTLESPMATSAQRSASLVAMVAVAAIGGLAPLIEQAIGGLFNLRLAGGAGLLALPAVVAIGALLARSRQVAASAAIVQGVTAGLLLFLWDHPRWHEIGAYDREDTAFNLFLAGVLIVDVVTLWAVRLPEPTLRPT